MVLISFFQNTPYDTRNYLRNVCAIILLGNLMAGFIRLRHFKKTKKSTTIIALLKESWMRLEAVLVAVFQHKPATGHEHVPFKNEVGQGFNRWHLEGRVGKYEIVLHHRTLNEFENICVYDFYKLLDVKRFGCLLHKFHAAGKLVHVGHILAAPGDELVAVVASATKKVEHFDFLKVIDVLQDVEQRLLGHVGGRPSGPFICGRMETPALEFARNDAHERWLKVVAEIALFTERQRVQVKKEMRWHIAELSAKIQKAREGHKFQISNIPVQRLVNLRIAKYLARKI